MLEPCLGLNSGLLQRQFSIVIAQEIFGFGDAIFNLFFVILSNVLSMTEFVAPIGFQFYFKKLQFFGVSFRWVGTKLLRFWKIS